CDADSAKDQPLCAGVADSGSTANRLNHRSRRARCSGSIETMAKPMPRRGDNFYTMGRTRTSPAGALKTNCRLVPTGKDCDVHMNKPPSDRFSTRETYFWVPFFQATRICF